MIERWMAWRDTWFCGALVERRIVGNDSLGMDNDMSKERVQVVKVETCEHILCVKNLCSFTPSNVGNGVRLQVLGTSSFDLDFSNKAILGPRQLE